VRSPHFIVVSNANEHDARLVANQFEMIRTVFLDYFGAKTPLMGEGVMKKLILQLWVSQRIKTAENVLPDPSDCQHYQRVHQRQDSMGEIHGSRISQQTELHQRDLFPPWRSGPGSWDPLKTRLGEFC
jgi:hypothetical protein